jgi:hypothetical protein
MSIVKEKYNADKINMLHQLLYNDKAAGKPREYEIKVDELKVVQRTSDPEQFLSHEDFVCDSTNSITITMYDGTSKRCTKYIYALIEKPTETEETVSGIEKTISSKMAQERRKWELEQLKEENVELIEKLDEAEKYVDKLEDKISALNAEKEKKKNKMTETFINLAGVYIAGKPNVLNGIPLIVELFGGGDDSKRLSDDNETQTTKEDSIASFPIKKKVTVPFTGEVNEEDYEKLGKSLSPFFKTELVGSVIHIVECLFKHNVLIEQTVNVIDVAIAKDVETKKAA